MLRRGWRRRPGGLPDRLAAELRDAIAMGRLPPGTPLPSERALSTQAEVSRTTVGAAVDQLVATGWVDRRNRSRSIARLPDPCHQALAPDDAHPATAINLVGARIAAPAELLTAAVDRARTRLTPYLLGDGREPFGQDELRAVVAATLSAEGLTTDAGQILITNGAMGALSALLDDSTGLVMVEDPTYHHALRLIAGRRRKVVPWTRGDRWDGNDIAAVVKRTRPALTYVVPDFHNPTGALADIDERLALAGLHQQLGTVVIDETLRDLDLRPPGSPMPPRLATLVPGAVTIGGLSKTIWSGLRVGWMRLPHTGALDRLARFADLHPVPILEQLVAVELWAHLDQTVTDRIARLRVQRDVLVDGARRHGLTVRDPEGGLVCWIDIGKPVAPSLAARMTERGLPIAPGSLFSAVRTYDQYVRIPFTSTGDTLTKVIDTLAEELTRLPAR